MKFDELPNITTQRVCIFVGAHVEMDDKLERAISEFCKNTMELFCAIIQAIIEESIEHFAIS